MDRIEALRTFVAVADARGFAQAARRLGISPAQATKLVARLEDRLHTRLLNRTTRDVSLTDAGRAFQARARAVIDEFDQLEKSAQEHASPRGLLKVSVPVSFGMQLGRALIEFAEEYPDVGLEVSVTDRMVNLVEEGFDVAIRVGRLVDSSLIARKLVTVRSVTVAAPDYLRRRGTPQRPADLEAHETILDLNRGDPQRWTYGAGAKRADIRVDGRLRFGNPYICVAAVAAGFGIAQEPEFAAAQALREGRVVQVLEKHEPDPATCYAVYPHARHLPAKVRAFVDFLAARTADEATCREVMLQG
jgi:DNA-binding transcriptional LysR family regulator